MVPMRLKLEIRQGVARDCIQRETGCTGPYMQESTVISSYVDSRRVDSIICTMGNPAPEVDPSPMPESTLSSQSGVRILPQLEKAGVHSKCI
jgi:hypothetical protein